jgi:hypothetical protein
MKLLGWLVDAAVVVIGFSLGFAGGLWIGSTLL